MSLAVSRVVRDQDRALFRQRTEEVSTLLQTLFTGPTSSLPLLGAVVQGSGGIAAFEDAAMPTVRSGRGVLGMGVAEDGGGTPYVVTAVGLGRRRTSPSAATSATWSVGRARRGASCPPSTTARSPTSSPSR